MTLRVKGREKILLDMAIIRTNSIIYSGTFSMRMLPSDEIPFLLPISVCNWFLHPSNSYARHGRVEEVDSLLLRGVSVDVRDDNGNTILLISCQNGNKRLVKLALRYGADINLCNFKGNTALHFCYRYGYAKTLGSYLKRKGADDQIRNLNGATCEMLGGTER